MNSFTMDQLMEANRALGAENDELRESRLKNYRVIAIFYRAGLNV